MRVYAWPPASAYSEALAAQAAHDGSDPRGTLEGLPGGLPKAYTGTFSTTFHFEAAIGDVALRCFTRGEDNLERRYTEIAELLRYVFNGALCRTRYEPHGVRVGGAWWPTVEMEWVAGRTLAAEIEARLGDGDALVELATSFREMVRSLGVLGIAHGDLQHANILVADGRLRLIDYDGMFVPALAGLAQNEFGHRNYQHPGRRMAPFDGRLDRFSSIVIYSAIMALAADPSLWARFNDDDNLLFRAHDFTSNGSSELFRAFLANNATSGLAQQLLAACRMPVQDVPTLEHVIDVSAGTTPRFVPYDVHDVLPLEPQVAAPVPPPAIVDIPAEDPLADPVFPTQILQPWPDEPEPVRPRRVFRRRFIPFVGFAALFVIAAVAAFAITVGPTLYARTAGRSAATPVALATQTPQPKRIVAAIARSSATRKPAIVPLVEPIATLAPAPAAATAVPTAALRPAAKRKVTVVAKTVRTSAATLRGVWQVDEANVYDGLMVWRGNVAVARGGAIELDVHKESIAGRSASRCERGTALHVSFPAGMTPQSVPYREVNCAGATSLGEVRLSNFSPSDSTFSGTFWQGGVRLGSFSARKL